MPAFFKKTLSFLGLAEEDDQDTLDQNFNYTDDSSRVLYKGYSNFKEFNQENSLNRFLNRKNIQNQEVQLHDEGSKRILGNQKSPRRLFAIDGAKDSNKIKVSIAQPHEFEEVQSIGDDLKLDIPVIVNLQNTNSDLAKRIIDFCSGLTYALEGSIKKVADRVFLITPKNTIVTSTDQEILKEKGLYNQL